ncbi:MAG: GyrI-like domain-containing protein [Desulfovibrio sp.]|jgi:AraC family transcriptional regulator
MRKSTRTDYQERILRVLQHIQENLDQNLDVRELADLACFSQAHFHRFFKGMLGESLGEHVRRLRLERAALRLLVTNQNVTNIALDAGYETPESFCRVFRRMFGSPPTVYRTTMRDTLYPRMASGVHYLSGEQRRELNVRPPNPSKENTMEVEIKEISPVRVAYMRHYGPYMEVDSVWNKLCAWAGSNGIIGPETRFYGVCHDDPQITPPDKIRYDACMNVPPGIMPDGPVGVQELFGGKWGTYRHVGPFDGLQECYNKIMGEWLPSSGCELREGPSIEIYVTDPKHTPAEQLVTEIYFPLV